MTIADLYRDVRVYTRNTDNALSANSRSLAWRLAEVFVRCWDLGFTSFGGPPVHFKILHERFVEADDTSGHSIGNNAYAWIDEQTYQELFAVSQALPGPASTKMVFCIVLIHAGLIPAIFALILWCLPGALIMYGFSLGVQQMPTILPPITYALLSGMNASTVGIIALAAVELAEKAIKDKLTRILVIFAACAGLCYSALWFFPLLIFIGGLCALVLDSSLPRKLKKVRLRLTGRAAMQASEASNAGPEAIESIEIGPVAQPEPAVPGQRRRHRTSADEMRISPTGSIPGSVREARFGSNEALQPSQRSTDMTTYRISLKTGLAIIASFLASFVVVMVLRGVLKNSPLALRLFGNMYLAGTIIFGGGPVVIPLLRSYVVDPGWVSPRDFLLGLAIIQALPGPNFNFGVYLGALTLVPTSAPSIVGALLGLAIFVPGLVLAVGVQSLWRIMRTRPWVLSVLRGVNAAAVGLVFTAVYRLWEIGYLTPETTTGRSLASEPWWVVVAVVTYAAAAWFKVPPAVAIATGAVLGIVWFGVVHG